MTLNNTLSNALCTINNAEKIGKKTCIVKPSSKIIKQVLQILKDKGYIGDFAEKPDNRGSSIEVNLLGHINNANIIRPYYAVKISDFTKFQKRYLPANDFGLIIMTTNKGLMSLDDAKTQNLGGKLLAYCY